MTNVSKKSKRYDKIKCITEIIIASSALVFTVFFSLQQLGLNKKSSTIANSNLELARSQLELSKNQVKSYLIPLLTSEHSSQRSMALYIAKIMDPSFATDIALLLNMNDADSQVRIDAESTLINLSKTGTTEVRDKSIKNLNRVDLLNEIRSKNLLGKLKDAEAYIRGQNVPGREKALELYLEVVNSLSKENLKSLDQGLLNEALDNNSQGQNDDALRKFRVLFSDYIRTDI